MFPREVFSASQKLSLFQILVKYVHDFQSCIFQVDLGHVSTASHLRSCPRWRIRMSSTSSKVERPSTINNKTERVGKHMLCHLAVKQYIRLLQIFVTKSLDESFLKVIQLCARSSSKAHTRSWLPKRPSDLKGDLSKHSPSKSYQSSLPGRYVPSIGSSARSSDDATGHLTNCKAAMVHRQLCETDILDYQVSDREEKEQKARVVAIAALCENVKNKWILV